MTFRTFSCDSLIVSAVAAFSIWSGGFGQAVSAETADSPPYPELVTAQTLADPEALARLERPGRVVLRDDFESDDSWKNYYEAQGRNEGYTRLTRDSSLAHRGTGALQVTAPNRNGKSSGAGVIGWLGSQGYDRLYMRRYVKFADDYDQGNLNHTGGGLSGVAGADKWYGMGKAGIRPNGDDWFSSRFEPWRDWGRYEPPGYMFLYTYWMDMRRDRDGNYWGNNLTPAEKDRIAIKRGRWYCWEHMIQVNTIGKADGELAAWIDGKLYIHYRGFRWRTAEDVRLKRFELMVYIHKSERDNTVWYDDLVLSTGYVGPTTNEPTKTAN